ncbi:scaffold protein [Microviridae sp.]|nr:scaffold protein [Microviridae sp.]
MFVRSAYNYDRNLASDECGLVCGDESRAVQSAEEEANINTIVRRFGISGKLPDQVAMPKSGDFSGVPDFHTAMNLVRQAQEEFVRIPADVRARFRNDPQEFMNFFENPDNYTEALKLGLVNARPPSAPADGGTPEA